LGSCDLAQTRQASMMASGSLAVLAAMAALLIGWHWQA
jgi:hypothetical protein